MYKRTTDRYGNTVIIGTYVASNSHGFNCCNIWLVHDVNADGTVILAQPDGLKQETASPDEIVLEECPC
jgi:hypothetical protein